MDDTMPLRTALKDVRLITLLLSAAESEARASGDSEPGAEHLLIAALELEDDSARVGLDRSADEVRLALKKVHAASLQSVGIAVSTSPTKLSPVRGLYRSSGSTQDTFRRAKVLARRSHTGLRTAHVLIAAAEREHGTIPLVLNGLGVDRSTAIAAAWRAIS